MGLLNWANSRVKKMTWVQIAMIELCVASLALLMAKLYPAVLMLEWHWYAAVGGVTYVYLMAFMFKK